MKYPRVNLLKKSEQRYQGAVSRRFMLISLVVTPVLFVAILSGVKLIQFTGIQSNLKASREIWADLKPRLSLYQEEQRGLNTNQKVLELIKGWKTTQLSMPGLMSEIQSAVPERVQLMRLLIAGDQTKTVYTSPADFVMDYKLAIQGVSKGDRAEDAVIGFRKRLLETKLMDETFESVKLTSMRKRVDPGGEGMREFMFEGFTAEGANQ